jgi:hypothetical protein
MGERTASALIIGKASISTADAAREQMEQAGFSAGRA